MEAESSSLIGQNLGDPTTAVLAALSSLRELVFGIMDERDKRYEQRFVAQEKALVLALDEVARGIDRVRLETSAALASADKAISKSEVSVDRRLEAMDTRTQNLINLSSTFLPRNEYDRAHVDLAERLDASTKAQSERMDTIVRTIADRFDASIKQIDERITQIADQINAMKQIVGG